MGGAVLLIIIVAIVIIILLIIGTYNGLVRLRNTVKNAWSQIDVQLKRRYDLIPNLVETAKGYMQHERGTFEAVTNARSQAMQAKSVAEHAKAETALGQALSQFLLVVENYPDLKANQNMMQLSEELTGTENKISFARQAFNDAVMSYNTAVEQFPSNVIANFFSFKLAELLQSTESPEEKKAVKVQF